ncbi:MAG: protein translocase subunit SecD [Lentisphaeria bacterium]|nr:protein translocase subunit SecD [Lentisphaeria bacterium]
MNKKPVLLRTIFTLIVVGVFVAAMFPLREKDFYETFLTLLENPSDPLVKELVANAKAKQESDKVKYPYASTALEAACKEIKVPGKDGQSYPVDLIKLVKPVIMKSQKLQNNGDVISLVRKNASGSFHLGIDLNGGAEFLLRLDPDEKAKANFDKFRDNAIETIRKRLAGQNIFETEISPAGQDFVSVRVPVVTKADKANLEKLILRSAKLEFRLVHPDNDTEVPKFERYLAQGGDPDAYPDTPPESEFLSMEERDSDGNLFYRWTLVENEVQMEGDQVEDASVRLNEFGMREIALNFTSTGAVQFGKVTTKYVHRKLAIVLDGKLYSAPNLKEPILGGSASISGNFSQDEAKSVADALVSGSLPFKITIASRSDIDATVGEETVRQSLFSGIIGTLLVIIFMIVYYRLAGVVADISLVVNALLLLGAMAAFDVTLTLPGIAGIILTIGMAVDANVLIYERIREEQNAGKTIRSAVDSGFDRAFSAIFDSNLTTLFIGLILFWQGTGAIKGFAMTLAIGIFTTLFTTVFLTRLLFDLILRIPFLNIQNLKMMLFLKNPHFDFIGARKFIIPFAVCCLVGSIVVFCVRGSDMLGIDFTGGTQLIVKYVPLEKGAERVPVSQIDDYLKSVGYDSRSAYKQVTDDDNKEGASKLEIVIRSSKDHNTQVSAEISDQLIRDLDAKYPQIQFTKESSNTLGALIGFAFLKSSVIALILSMIGMIIYMVIRFQFSYSIAANIALVHDVIVSMGIYALCGGQLTLQVMASLLTLIGYSVNDTIVTFDRQRENLRLLQGSQMTYSQIVNLSVNQTLARTILTSLSVLLILLSQIFFGGEGIRDFISVMFIGCVVGCYSSIFISPLITAYWHKSSANIREDAHAGDANAEDGKTADPA